MTTPPIIRTAPVFRLHELGWAMDNAIPGYSQAEVLKRFQMASLDREGMPLEVDGVFGQITFDALFKEYPLPGQTLASRVLAVAKSQLGVSEIPLGSNRGPQVDIYLKTCGLNPVGYNYPWCAAFVYWCFVQASRQLRIKNPWPKSAGVLNLWDLAGYKESGLKRITMLQAEEEPELVKPGMIFILKTSAKTGHMGLIEGINNRFWQLSTYEGNSNTDGSRDGKEVTHLNKRRIETINQGFISYE